MQGVFFIFVPVYAYHFKTAFNFINGIIVEMLHRKKY